MSKFIVKIYDKPHIVFELDILYTIHRASSLLCAVVKQYNCSRQQALFKYLDASCDMDLGVTAL